MPDMAAETSTARQLRFRSRISAIVADFFEYLHNDELNVFRATAKLMREEGHNVLVERIIEAVPVAVSQVLGHESPTIAMFRALRNDLECLAMQ